jgi:hypothetical protein
MPVPVIDVDTGVIRSRRTEPVKEEPGVVSHNPGCIVHQHYHGWQPARYRRCSASFWCASCQVWFHGGRCFPSQYR